MLNLLLFCFCIISISAASPPARDWSLLTSGDTLDLYMNDRLVGTLSQTIAIREKEKKISVERCLDIGSAGNADPSAPKMNLLEQRTYGFDGALSGAHQELTSAAGVSAWKLRKTPQGAWKLAVTTGGRRQEQAPGRVIENLAMTYELYKGIKKRTIKPGDVLHDTAFDLTTAQTITMTVVCKERPSTENGGRWVFGETNSALGREERWDLDTNGITVYQEIYPFVGRKKGTGGGAQETAPLFSMVEALAVPASRPAEAGERIALVLDTGAVPDSSVAAWYCKEGSAWVVIPPPASCADTGTALPSGSDERTFTAPTPTIQCDDSRIKKLAAKLVRGKKSRCDTIRALYEHVYRTLEKRYLPTFSNAIETLEAGYGDCGEHAVLLAALLRGASVPARVVLGLVYIADKKGYFYHAWVMAYSHGQWVFIDPALGVFPARRDRVPLVLDDTGKNIFSIAKLIGRVRIEYVR